MTRTSPAAYILLPLLLHLVFLPRANAASIPSPLAETPREVSAFSGLPSPLAGEGLGVRGISPILAVPIAINNEVTDPVLLQSLNGSSPLTPLPTIPGYPANNLNNPITTVFSSTGELFVGNRHTGQTGTEGTIARFTFDNDGNYIPNGFITGNGLSNVHGMDFDQNNELFAVSYRGNQISRFEFDSFGNASANGTVEIPIPPGSDHANLGLEFAPWGELFASVYDSAPTPMSTIHRYLFGEDGLAIPNGSFILPTTGAHFLEFNAAGELFVPDNSASVVYRYLFDDNDQPVANGTVSVGLGAVGVAFSPDGELFVSHQTEVGILRFLFDDDGNAIPNGQELAGTILGEVSIYPTQAVPEVSAWVMMVAGVAGAAFIFRRPTRPRDA